MTFVLLTESPTPAPAEMEPWEVSPGLEGFLLGFFLLALAVVPLFLSMAKHMRRVDHNERLRQRAEAAADDGPDGPLDGDVRRDDRGPGGTTGVDSPDGAAGWREDGSGDGGARRVVQSPTD
ncbi:hypothetical protein [Georgenia daeguensis]|uniref:Uncharacterized protein n=1 Tax=Georgenia daeguensis TaxID=908355 RepID=A0ABP8EXL8_9MICO